MIFLTVVAWAVFILLTVAFVAIFVTEAFKSKRQREVEESLHRLGDALGRNTRTTYWNRRMYTAVILWIATGTFIFW
jgi:hypothetical protein